MLFSYTIKLVVVLTGLLCIPLYGVSQISTSDCDEKPDSPKKLFVFVGELLKTETIPADVRINNAKFKATYKITERVCGIYLPDSITVEVIQTNYDSTFKNYPTQLVILTKDTILNSPYYLWADLYFEVLKTANNRWAVPLGSKDPLNAPKVTPSKYEKIKFSNKSHFNIIGLTQEEINTNYPEFFFKIKNGKAIPKYGNTIDEIFELHKDRTLTYAGIYDRTLTNEVFEYSDAEIEQIFSEKTKIYRDSVKNIYDTELQAIRDSLTYFPFNEKLIWKLISNCRVRNEYSFCDEYFEKLLEKYPDSINAYITLANFKHRQVSPDDTMRILLYKKALALDSNHYEINYVIAESFYNLFQKKKDPHYAISARNYLIRCTEIDKKQLFIFKHPIIQLSNYLHETSTAKTYFDPIYVREDRAYTTQDTSWYFPADSLIKDIKNWSTNYSINLLKELKNVTNKLNGYSDELKWLKEPNFINENNKQVYRFLWSRSFHMPIVIRMERKKENITISWKQSYHDETTDIYDPGTLFQKDITWRQWRKFEKMLAKIDYWSMYAMGKSDIMDGSYWILEASINGKHKITERQGSVYKQYTNCLKYLIRLTDLKIPKKEIY
jgi:hypothetical protein